MNTTRVYKDDRGYFREIMRGDIRQINQSFSKKGTVRGLHYQEPQVTKYIWVPQGRILDVIFNLQTGEVVEKELSADNHEIMVCPKGWAHGFHDVQLAPPSTYAFTLCCEGVFVAELEYLLMV